MLSVSASKVTRSLMISRATEYHPDPQGAAGQSLGVDYPARFLRVAVAHRGVVAGVPG